MFSMYADDDAFWNPHTDVAALVAALGRSPGQHTRLTFEHAANGLVIGVPAFGELADGVVTFKCDVGAARVRRRDVDGTGLYGCPVIVVLVVTELFPRLGSPCGALTWAMFCTAPASRALTTMVTVALPLLASMPRSQSTPEPP